MSETPEQIISDEEIAKVHGFANFGSMTPREVVNDGVRKYAVGFTGGSTQVAILREHGLITAPKNTGYQADLTAKGKRYARSIWNTRTPPQITDVMVDEAMKSWYSEEFNHDMRAALAAAFAASTNTSTIAPKEKK